MSSQLGNATWEPKQIKTNYFPRPTSSLGASTKSHQSSRAERRCGHTASASLSSGTLPARGDMLGGGSRGFNRSSRTSWYHGPNPCASAPIPSKLVWSLWDLFDLSEVIHLPTRVLLFILELAVCFRELTSNCKNNLGQKYLKDEKWGRKAEARASTPKSGGFYNTLCSPPWKSPAFFPIYTNIKPSERSWAV